jgi:hypothetical protein
MLDELLLVSVNPSPDSRTLSTAQFRAGIEAWIDAIRMDREKASAGQAGLDAYQDEVRSSLHEMITFKKSYHDIPTLRKVQHTIEETVVMKVSDTLAAKGARLSPKQTAARLAGLLLAVASLSVLAYYATTQHGVTIGDAWSQASLSLSKLLPGAEKGPSIKVYEQAPVPYSQSPLVRTPEKVYRAPVTQSQPGQLKPADEWPKEKLLQEVPYDPRAAADYRARNNMK